MPENQKFLTIDVGKAWTKVFLSEIAQDNKVQILSSSRLPTSHPDLTFSINTQLSAIKSKPEEKILVTALENGEELAKEVGAKFVPEENSQKELVSFFKKSNEKISILDAGASSFDTPIDAKEIGKYLSFSIPETNLENFLGNKAHRPHHLPRNTKDLEIEEAFLRKTFSQKMAGEESRALFLVVTGGLFSHTPDVSRLALLLMDILQGEKIAEVVFDRETFLPSFGALLSTSKRLQMTVGGDWLDKLGTLISLTDSKTLKLDWGFSQIQEVELAAEEIAFIPAEADQRIEIQFSAGKEKIKASVFGGTLGLVLDARAKPLDLAFGQESSRKKVAEWLKSVQKTKSGKEAF